MAIPIDGGGRNKIEVIAGYAYKVASKFKGLWELTSGWIFPFNLLSWYFYWAWAWVDLIADNLLDFAHGYFSVVGVLEDMWGMLRLDDWSFWFKNEWQKFLENPIYYVVNIVKSYIHDWETLTFAPGKWILSELQLEDSGIHKWLIDIPKEFTLWAQDNHPFLYNLLFDKIAFIAEIVDSFSWEAAYIIRDPKHAIQYLLSLWLDLPMGFWGNPGEGIVLWFVENLVAYYRKVAKSLFNVAESVIIEQW